MPMEPTFDDLAVTLFEAFPNALHVRQRVHGTIFGVNPRDERLTHVDEDGLRALVESTRLDAPRADRPPSSRQVS